MLPRLVPKILILYAFCDVVVVVGVGIGDSKSWISGENLVVGLATSTGVLLLLLIFVIIGVVVFIYKIKTSAKRAMKTDVNPLYGVDYEREEQNPRSSVAEESYDYMGN